VKRFCVLLLVPLALGGCSLPGGAPGGPGYRVTAEFSDGTTAQVAASHGTFILISPPSKKLAALRPMVAKFPELRCPIAELQIPAIPGGPPGSTTYVDGGCTGYTGKFRPFG